MSIIEHYSYKVAWSPEDAAYIGTVAELPSVSWAADSSREAFDGIRRAVADIAADMAQTGESLPPAIADRPYSGKFMVRTTPATHRKLVAEAAEQGVSLNRVVSAKLAA